MKPENHTPIRTASGGNLQSSYESLRPFKILRLKQVLERIGISRAQIYVLMGEGLFPKNFSLSGPNGRSVGWLESDVSEWISSRSEQQQKTGGQ